MKLSHLLILCLLLPIQINLAADKKVKVYTNGLQVHSVKGMNKYTTEDGKEDSCKVGMTLYPGTTLQTGPDSEISLLSPDGDRYHVEANSSIVLSKPIKQKLFNLIQRKKNQKKGPSTLEMLKGKINVYVKPEKDDQVKISSSLTILSVKGTSFSAEIRDQVMILDVWEGIVEMERFDGSHIEISAGFQADTKTWQSRKIKRDQHKKLEIDILDDLKRVEPIEDSKPKFDQPKFPDIDVKAINFDRRRNSTFNWSTYNLEIEINHPARNPSHQRSSEIKDLPPAPPTR